MVCKRCSFKSYCIEPWIPSITELQNGNKKKKIPLPPSQPSLQAVPWAGQAAVSPSPTPSQLRPAACTGEPASTLALRLRPHPGIKVKGEGFLAPLEPSDPMAKFQAGLRPAQLLQALALRHLRGPP